MKNMSDVLPPIYYEDLKERLLEIREMIYEGAGCRYGFPPENVSEFFDLTERFWQDRALRETAAEVFLGAVLWVEAGRPTQEVLHNCRPEIQKLMVYTSNCLLEYLQLKSHTQKEGSLYRGSLVDAWIRLFVEFRESLGRESDRWMWQQIDVPYGPSLL
jgi:hypothetical protein